jgi:hypothetical protein
MNTLLNAMYNETNCAYTENGAKVRKSTGSALLDFFSKGGALRNSPESFITGLLDRALSEDATLATRIMFYFRDVRGGQGQRDAFRKQLKYLANTNGQLALKIMRFVPEYGRWDDLYAFVDTPLENKAFLMMRGQIAIDGINMENGGEVSLLAKWLKSENTSSPVSKYLARKTRQSFGMTSKEYRKRLSSLRKHLDVVERKISANKLDEIEYSKVPSQAMFRYRNAFNKKDYNRYQTYLDKVSAGEEKINAGTLYPYQIVKDAFPDTFYGTFSGDRKSLDVMWNALPDYIAGSQENSIAVIDTSGSMYGTPIYVAISLGIYMAERAKGPFKNHFLTFSESPKMVRIEGTDIVSKVDSIKDADWGSNTNLMSVFNLILDSGIKNNIPPNEMVQKLYIISDMQFDSCITHTQDYMFNDIKNKFINAGYSMPKLVFWNVDSRDNSNVPMSLDDRGFLNVSGFSPSIFEALMNNEVLDAYEMMLQVINSNRYKEILNDQ